MRASKNLILSAASVLVMTFALVNCSKDMVDQSVQENTTGNNLKKGTLTASTVHTIEFCNRTWNVKSADGMGPGNNNWNPNNVWVDDSGRLHLLISYNIDKNKWDCAEVWTKELLGFGTYEWTVEGRIDKLQENIVLGLFNYLPTTTQGAKKTAEIDIEFSKWSDPLYATPGGFTVWPNKTNLKRWTYPFASYTTDSEQITRHRFTWTSKSVSFTSVDGAGKSTTATYSPSRPTQYIPQTAEPAHINLWITGTKSENTDPNKKLAVELIISNFTYTK